MPDIRELAGYGFSDLRSYFGVRIADIEGGPNAIAERMDSTLYRYTEEFYQTMTNLFVERTTRAKERYLMPGGGRLQPLEAEHGIPRPTEQYQGYDIGTHIEAAGDAFGDNRISRNMVTVGDANRATQEIQLRDYNWNIDRMLAAMLAREEFQYEDLTRLGYQGAGLLTVYPLANGDDATYIKARGRSVATDNHYTAVEGALSTTNDPFPAIKRNLTEHGTDPDARVTVYVADNLVADIGNMGHFIPRSRPDVREGTQTATVSNVPDRGIGEEVMGMVSGCWIIACSALPDDYMLAHMEGRRPLSMREYPSANLQGLFRESVNHDGNHMQTSFLRIAGYAGRDRTAAVAVQVNAAAGAQYATPEEFALPVAS